MPLRRPSDYYYGVETAKGGNTYYSPWQTQPGLPPSSAAAAAAVGAPSGSSSQPGSAAISALPGEGIYQQQQLAANRAYEQALADLKAQRLGTFQQYGFDAQGNNLDPNNPYGAFQQNQRAHAEQLISAEEDAIGRGLGSHGLGAQVEEAPRYQQGVEDTNLARSYQDTLHGIDRGELQARQDLQDALMRARQDQIQAALENQWFTMAPWGDGSTGPDGSPSTAASEVSDPMTQRITHLQAGNLNMAQARRLVQHVMRSSPKPKPKPKPKPRTRTRYQPR